MPLTASSLGTLDFVHHNLEKCLQTHSACRDHQVQLKTGVNDNWPRRILVIDAESSIVRLADFEPSMQSKYVALSYCWGEQEGHLTATKETLPKLRRGTKIDQLPATLQDAVTTTIQLGSSYIWIDSICIIQDDRSDPSDWYQEAGKMSTVYAQSLVTLIASSAVSCSEGFLEKRRGQSIQIGLVRVESQITEIRARTIYDWGHHRGGPQAEDSSYKRWMDPVDGRGWTLQERLLSGRYINFTTGEAQWGCLTTRACECDQTLYGSLYEASPPEKEWFSIVEEYATRKLTVPTDKLTALAGIARKMSTDLSWKWYGAGIWLTPDYLPFTIKGLLWKRRIFSARKPFYDGYVAPSFSWASIPGEVVHSDKDGCTFPSQILGIEARPVAEDPFGQVSSAFLRLYGPLISAKLKWEKDGMYPDLQAGVQRNADRDYMKSVYLDGPVELVSVTDGQCSVQRKSMASEIAECSFEGVDVYLLPLSMRAMTYNTGSKSDAGYHDNYIPAFDVECLLLARSMRFSGYERLGLCSWTHDSISIDSPCAEVCLY
ncbi:putative Heterokaryon incompatibility domain-containing protein [Seiridium cardinale]